MRKRILMGLIARIGGFAASILSGLVVPSLLFRHFPVDTLGAWYLISGTTMVAGLMQFGFPEIVTRFAAFSSSSGKKAVLDQETQCDLPTLVGVAFHATRYIAGLACLGSFVFSAIIIWPLHLPPNIHWKALEAAGMVAVGLGLAARYRFWDCFITGIGDTHIPIIIGMLNALFYSVLQIGVALFWPDIRGLALAFLIQTISGRILLAAAARNRYDLLGRTDHVFDWPLFKKLFALSLKQWAATLCAFIVLRTSQYFLAIFFTGKEVAYYTAAFNLVTFLSAFAALGSAIANPFISRLWAEGNLDKVRRLVLLQLRCSLIIMLAGGAVVLSCGEGLFDLWLGKGKYIGNSVLILLVVMNVLELHHSIMVTFLYSINRVNLYIPAALAAVLSIVFTLAFVKPFGVIGVPLGTFVAQLCTSYWYGTYRALPELRLPFWSYAVKTLAPLCLLAGGLALSGWPVTAAGVSPAKHLAFAMGVCTCITVPAIWFWGLDATTRQWLTQALIQKTLKKS